MITLNIFTILSFFITALLVFIAHRMFVHPYLALTPYRKLKHIKTLIRARLIPNMKQSRQDAEKHGDWYYFSRKIVQEDPDCRAIVSINGPILFVNLFDPDLLKEFFKLHQQQPELYDKNLRIGVLRMFLQDGLFSAEGNIWKKHRRIDSQAFHFDFVRKQVAMIRRIAKDYISKINPNEQLPAISFFQEITGEVVCRTFFGSGLASQTVNGKSFSAILAELLSDIFMEAMTLKHILFKTYYVKYFPSAHLKRILQRMEEFKQTCRNIVAERKIRMKNGEISSEAEHDLLYHLLKYQQDNPQDNFNDEEILHEFITFFMAGLDTTGHLLGMATYYISRTTGVKEKLREEINSVFGADDESEVTFEDLSKLEYMLSVFNETLRLASPAPTLAVRNVVKSHKLGDLPLKKGTLLMPNFILNFTNAKYFENPTEFSPDRWRNASGKVTSVHPQNPYIFTPFSTGSRNCIGQHMALLEAKVILSEFMRVFDFEVPSDYKLRMTIRFLYEPLDELKLNLRKI